MRENKNLARKIHRQAQQAIDFMLETAQEMLDYTYGNNCSIRHGLAKTTLDKAHYLANDIRSGRISKGQAVVIIEDWFIKEDRKDV